MLTNLGLGLLALFWPGLRYEDQVKVGATMLATLDILGNELQQRYETSQLTWLEDANSYSPRPRQRIKEYEDQLQTLMPLGGRLWFAGDNYRARKDRIAAKTNFSKRLVKSPTCQEES